MNLLVKDYCAARFGPAAGDMEQYIWTLAKATRRSIRLAVDEPTAHQVAQGRLWVDHCRSLLRRSGRTLAKNAKSREMLRRLAATLRHMEITFDLLDARRQGGDKEIASAVRRASAPGGQGTRRKVSSWTTAAIASAKPVFARYTACRSCAPSAPGISGWKPATGSGKMSLRPRFVAAALALAVFPVTFACAKERPPQTPVSPRAPPRQLRRQSNVEAVCHGQVPAHRATRGLPQCRLVGPARGGRGTS